MSLNIDEIQRKLDKSRRATKDLHLGGEPVAPKTEQQLEAEATGEAVREAGEAALLARLQELEAENAKLKRLERKWRDGDYTDLGDDHPFEITVHTDNSGLDSKPVIEPEINGQKWAILRGHPTRVPHKVVKHLNHLKYDYATKEVGPDGNLMIVQYKAHRFPFSAHPIH